MFDHIKKPIFNFFGRKTKIFNLEKDNFDTIYSWMDEYVLEFNTVYQNQIATGLGAYRQV